MSLSKIYYDYDDKNNLYHKIKTLISHSNYIIYYIKEQLNFAIEKTSLSN